MSTTTDEIRKARIQIWTDMPKEVENIVRRRDILQPAGNLLYAEAVTREFTELLWTFIEGLRTGTLEENVVRKALEAILDHLAVRLGGFYGLESAASLVRKSREQLGSCPPGDLLEMLHEVRLYLGRLNLWLDLLVPWYEINEELRAGPKPS